MKGEARYKRVYGHKKVPSEVKEEKKKKVRTIQRQRCVHETVKIIDRVFEAHLTEQ